LQSSSYDLEAQLVSNVPDEDFVLQDDKPWVLVSLFGQVLIIWANLRLMMKVGHPEVLILNRFRVLPKDRFYLYRSRWNTKESTFIFCHIELGRS
jgi:beta-galactosidase